MSKVKLGNDHTFISINGNNFCLSHLTSFLFNVANHPTNDNIFEIQRDLGNLFPDLDQETQNIINKNVIYSVESGKTPEFNKSRYYKLKGSAAYGAANVNGYIELLFKDDYFILFGYQIKINPVILFGIKRSFQNVYSDVKNILTELYDKDLNVLSQNPLIESVHNKKTHSYFSSITQCKNIVFTYRIGNRNIWDNFIDMQFS